ncbi:hypothetical protein [Amorphus sp. 3PC139-8]|uniref:hypothetical protein n=1 Tax=Amorphus sp. 3PC139-8 TaxID=2735676 RepID=UPI00345CDC63
MSVVTLHQLHGKAKSQPSRPAFDLGSVRFDIEEITPGRAEQLLGKVRPGVLVDPKAVNAYAESMKAGAWIFNGMPIVLSNEGAVLDGIQRLHAVVRSETPIKTLVAYGVRDDTMHTMDQHRRRSYVGVLESRGERNPGPLQRLAAKMIRIENGVLGVRDLQIGWTRFDRVIDTNPLLREAVQISTENADAALRATARHALVFMALSAGHKKLLTRFLLALRHPDEFPADEPAVVLANQLSIARDQGTPFGNNQSLAMAVLAFNDMISGERHKSYIWKPTYGKAKTKRKKGEEEQTLPLEGSTTSARASRRAPARSNAPVDRAQLLNSPPNLGLPLVTGYPGLRDAKINEKRSEVLEGPLVEALRSRQEAEDEQHPYEMEAMTVTPETADDWLARFNIGNRNIQESHVKMIARDIAQGNWMFNAQPICFSKQGRLLNGQHRLRAAVEADQPIDILVVRNVPDEAFATYDTHAKKGIPSGVTFEAEKVDERVVLAAARILWRVENEISAQATQIKPSASEIDEIIRRHPGLALSVTRGRRMHPIASAAVMTFITYYTWTERSDYADDFLNAIETGENLTKDNPVLKVRNQLLQGRGSDYNRRNAIGVLLDCWNAYCAWRDKQEE